MAALRQAWRTAWSYSSDDQGNRRERPSALLGLAVEVSRLRLQSDNEGAANTRWRQRQSKTLGSRDDSGDDGKGGGAQVPCASKREIRAKT